MSMKTLVVVLGVVGAVVATVNAPQPDPATAAPEVLAAAVVPEGAVARIGYGFGAIGSHLVGGRVFSLTQKAQLDIEALRPAVKKARGGDADRARKSLQTAEAANRLALQSVYTADPVVALQSALKARNFIDIAKTNLRMPN